MDRTTNNLPLQLSSFIGREREIAEVRRLLASARLVTLTGAGGSGKTRLAIETLSAFCRDGSPEDSPPVPPFADGVWFVELAALLDADLVPQAVASVLGVAEQKGRPLSAALMNFAHGKNLLIVLDSCEHLIDACAQLTESLLQTAAHVSILATSREPLSIAGEYVYPVPPLAAPLAGQMLSMEQVKAFDAVRLFVVRAQAALGRFELTDANAAAIGQICRQLDGIPLAIELAAARLRALGIEEIAARLTERFQLLTRSQRGLLHRHQTLRSVIDWSYNLLTREERILFQRLSVFAGGWGLEAAEDVAAVSSQEINGTAATSDALHLAAQNLARADILDVLTRLIDKSLVSASEQAGATRYRMLETIQQYAAEKLRETGESELLRHRHLDHFLKLAEAAEPALCSSERAPWLDRLLVDHENLRAALRWAIVGGRTETGLRLAAALLWFWRLRNFSGEARRWYTELLALTDASKSPAIHAKALYSAGHLAWSEDDYQSARALAEQSVLLWRRLSNPDGLAYALSLLGIVLYEYREYEPARMYEQESVSLFRVSGSQWGASYALLRLGMIAREQRDFALARRCDEESAHIARQLGDPWLLAFPLSHLGSLALHERDYAEARLRFEERLVLHRQIGDKQSIAAGLNFLGEALRGLGDFAQAEIVYAEADDLYQELQSNKSGWADIVNNLGRTLRMSGDKARAARYHRRALKMRIELVVPAGVALSLEAIGLLGAVDGRHARAARLLSAADAIFANAHMVLDAVDQPDHDNAVADIRMRLGDAQFSSAWAEGRSLTREQAILEAEGLIDDIESGNSKEVEPDLPPGNSAGLSAREIEVLRLLAHGLTNPQIAEQLVISTRTVNAHLRSIYGKLDVTTRTAAARVAIDHKLI